MQLENDYLRLTILEDASGEILDKVNGHAWRMGPVAYQDVGLLANNVVWNRGPRDWADYYIGRFKVREEGDGLTVSVLAPPWISPRGTFRAHWTLDGREAVLRVEDIDDNLPSLNFPPPIDCASLVLPTAVGQWIRKDQPSMRCYFKTQNNGLNMRWVGGLAKDDDAGWLFIADDNYADQGVYQCNLSICPTYLKSKGVWDRSRSVRYCFCDGGYVGLAKKFRAYAEEHKLFRKLPEKIQQTPALENLLGGRIVSMFQSYTPHASSLEEKFRPITEDDRARDGQVQALIPHADARKIMNMARSWGMQRGLFNLRGTFMGGYDEHHPDIWPPEPALGSIDELKACIRQDGPILVALHDNYQDMYQRTPTFPNDLVIRADGQPLWGGYWHGGLCFITCSKRQAFYARRNWEQLRTLDFKACFVDTLSCVQFYECYDPDHPMRRIEDGPAKVELMKFFKEQGLVLGSEEAADFGMAHIDFLENRHTHVPHESIPIWPLVFHDAAFYARYSTGGTSGGAPVRQLENWLWGYMCYWPANNLASWPAQEQAFKASLDLDAFHARVGLDEMLTHRYLDDGLVEQTEFASGLSVLANFAGEPRTIQGRTIAPESCVVVE